MPAKGGAEDEGEGVIMLAVHDPVTSAHAGRAQAAAEPVLQERALVHEQAPINWKDLWLDVC